MTAPADARNSALSLTELEDPPEHRLHRWTAAFHSPELEAEFLHEQFHHSTRRFTRMSLAICFASMMLYGAHDALVVPTVRMHAWALRYGIFGLPGLLILVFTYSRLYERFQQPAVLFYGLACNAAVLSIASIAPPNGYFLYTSYAVLFVTLGPFIGRMNVVTQTIYVVCTIGLYNLLDLQFARSAPEIGIALNGTLLAMGTIGILLARQQEFQYRQTFLQRRAIRAQTEALAREQARSEALLLNILPSTVAERLKASERPIADGFADVTVLFADVVGFTAMSARISPAEVVRRLDEFFSACDALVDKLGLEKIKTIGDAYMAAGGLDARSRDEHAKKIVLLAQGMLEAIEKVGKNYNETLSVRIGIHTGPVVAGVIGTRKFIYDIWGDTVNTASRMESHGVPGAIQISQATRERLGDDFPLEDRGEIELKGKGRMRTYLWKP